MQSAGETILLVVSVTFESGVLIQLVLDELPKWVGRQYAESYVSEMRRCSRCGGPLVHLDRETGGVCEEQTSPCADDRTIPADLGFRAIW